MFFRINISEMLTPTCVGVCISPTRMDPRPTNSARILARSSSFCVPRRTKLVCGHSSGRPHVLFSPHGGLVCGRLAIRPHTSFTHAEGAGVWAFITSPTRPSPSPHPKLVVAMCFCRVHGNCPSFACKQMATLFYPSCHVFLHGTWQLPQRARTWQLP